MNLIIMKIFNVPKTGIFGLIDIVGLDLISFAAFLAFSIISFPPCPCTVINPQLISSRALIAL